jgi:IPT/TIG domain/Glucose / Sorbosone dehydrogenase
LLAIDPSNAPTPHNFYHCVCFLQVVYHSNGYLYGTDNGPNTGFGRTSTSCTTDADDANFPDKVNVILKGHYYGHPNRLRAQLYNDTRQCKFRSREEASDAEFTAPIAKVGASTNGILEWQSAHFANQLRGQLLITKYNGDSSTVKLAANGLSSIQVTSRGTGGLDVTQGPDGTMFFASHGGNKIIYKKPNEPIWGDLRVLSCFPRRGPLAGGTKFRVYGQALDLDGLPQVMVGGKNCADVIVLSSSEIECTLPSATAAGKASVFVASGTFNGTLADGYRYATFAGGPPP